MELNTRRSLGFGYYADLVIYGINKFLATGYNEHRQRISTIELSDGSQWQMNPLTGVYSIIKQEGEQAA